MSKTQVDVDCLHNGTHVFSISYEVEEDIDRNDHSGLIDRLNHAIELAAQVIQLPYAWQGQIVNPLSYNFPCEIEQHYLKAIYPNGVAFTLDLYDL